MDLVACAPPPQEMTAICPGRVWRHDSRVKLRRSFSIVTMVALPGPQMFAFGNSAVAGPVARALSFVGTEPRFLALFLGEIFVVCQVRACCVGPRKRGGRTLNRGPPSFLSDWVAGRLASGRSPRIPSKMWRGPQSRCGRQPLTVSPRIQLTCQDCYDKGSETCFLSPCYG